MDRTILTQTRPSLDIPWYGSDQDPSADRKNNLQIIINYLSTFYGDRFQYTPPAADSLTWTVFNFTYTPDEIQYTDLMALNPHGEIYNEFKDFLDYAQANNIEISVDVI